jgi:hypothetical protein
MLGLMRIFGSQILDFSPSVAAPKQTFSNIGSPPVNVFSKRGVRCFVAQAAAWTLFWKRLGNMSVETCSLNDSNTFLAGAPYKHSSAKLGQGQA